MKASLLFIQNILIFCILLKEINTQTCQIVQCSKSKETESQCIKVDGSVSTFTPCKSDLFCDIKTEDPDIEAQCKPKEITKEKKYAGLDCTEDTDCFSSSCREGKCYGFKEGENCTSTSECDYSLTCLYETNKCSKPKLKGDKCDIETDCESDCGCLNGICVAYFSKEDGELVSSIYKNNELNFCKSGYMDDIGICQTIYLENQITECDLFTNNCKYYKYNSYSHNQKTMNNFFDYIKFNIDNAINKDIENKPNKNITNITIPENCLCGYNNEGKNYCLIGNGNENYTLYLNQLKAYRLKNSNCHLDERSAKGCMKDLLSGDKRLIEKIHEMINAKYWAKYNNRLINTPDCVYPIELPEYDRALDEKKQKNGACAVYKCLNTIPSKKQQLCASSNYFDKFNIVVQLSDSCPDNIQCNVYQDPNVLFYNGTDVNLTCSASRDLSKMSNKYPGEKCDVDLECKYPIVSEEMSQFHKCVEKRCSGLILNSFCKDNSWCSAGYFCDYYTSKCKEQLKKGEECLNSKDCQNNLLCYEGTCQDILFSLKEGESVPENEDYEFQKKYCQSGEIRNNKCVSYILKSGMMKKDKNEDSEYIKCNFGDKCVYLINGLGTQEELSIDCPCGYNQEGVGYCPKFYDSNNTEWKIYHDALKESFFNECHTENRYHCYNDDKKEIIKEKYNKLINGHLFYHSVECAEDVLSDNYLNLSKIKLYLIFNIIILFLSL